MPRRTHNHHPSDRSLSNQKEGHKWSKFRFGSLVLPITFGFLLFSLTTYFPLSSVLANPSGGRVISGQATISGVGTPQVVITQTTQKAILHFNSFDIRQNESTRINQLSSSSWMLGRILDNNPSRIDGSLFANGNLILLNRNGILFGPNAQVNVNGLIASTLNLTNEHFLAGHYLFTGQIGNGLIRNEGTIQAGPGGVYLFAPQIENTGLITNPEGYIALTASTKAYLSDRPDGNGFLVEVKAPAGETVNLGNIQADGGHIHLAALTVNQEGLVQANSIRNKNGKIEIIASDELNIKRGSKTLARGDRTGTSSGGTIFATSDKSHGKTHFEDGALIDISGGQKGGDAGFAEVSGANVKLGGTFNGQAADGFQQGRVLIDPVFQTVDTAFLSSFANSNLEEVTVEADRDITVTTNFAPFDFKGWSRPSGEVTLSFDAGQDLIFQNMFLTTSETNPDGTIWNMTGVAGRNIEFRGGFIVGGVGGRFKFDAGQDIVLSPSPNVPGFLPLLSNGVTGGDISLRAINGTLRAPLQIDSPDGIVRGIRLDGPGTLNLDVAKDFIGGTLGSQALGPGVLVSQGEAKITVGGQTGAPDTTGVFTSNGSISSVVRKPNIGNSLSGKLTLTIPRSDPTVQDPVSIDAGDTLLELNSLPTKVRDLGPMTIELDGAPFITETGERVFPVQAPVGGEALLVNDHILMFTEGSGPLDERVFLVDPTQVTFITNRRDMNVLIGEGADVQVQSGGDAFIGTVSDVGLSDTGLTNKALTVSGLQSSKFSVRSLTSNIHLKPTRSGLAGFAPSSLEVIADNGSIFLEKSLNLWASESGNITFRAKRNIESVAAVNAFLNTERSLLNTTIPFPCPQCPEGNIAEGEVDRLIEAFPFPRETAKLMLTPRNERSKFGDLSINFVKGDPNLYIGKDQENAEAIVNARPSDFLSDQVGQVQFTTLEGDIRNIQLELESPNFKKEVTIDAGGEIRRFVGKIPAPSGTVSTIRTPNSLDLSGFDSGLTIFGSGTARLEVGKDLLLGDIGINHFFKLDSTLADQGGLLDIALGGNLIMTASKILSENGASVAIHGLGSTPVLQTNGQPNLDIVAQGIVGSDGFLRVNGEEVEVRLTPIRLDGTQSIFSQSEPLVLEGPPVVTKEGKQLFVVKHRGKAVIVNDQIVLEADGKVFLADASNTSLVNPAGGTLNVGTSEPSVFGADRATGIITTRGGSIDLKAHGDINVNLSRVATLGTGNITVTSTEGNISAGSGGRDEITSFQIRTDIFDEVTGEIVGQDVRTFFVPGSGIFTFHPDDPLPLVFPDFDTPEITALKNEKIKLDFLGRDTTSIDNQISTAVERREPAFRQIFDAFASSVLLGDIRLFARNSQGTGTLIVPPAGIRGRDVIIDADQVDLQGGTISGRININAESVNNVTAVSFSGTTSGAVSSAGSSGGGTLAPLGGSTGTVTTGASTTAATSSTSSSSVGEAEEITTQQATREVKAKAQAETGVGADSDKGTAGTALGNLKSKRGVTIDVEIETEEENEEKETAQRKRNRTIGPT